MQLYRRELSDKGPLTDKLSLNTNAWLALSVARVAWAESIVGTYIYLYIHIIYYPSI